MTDEVAKLDPQRRARGFTIADVARTANVSLGTVSNVLNGTRAVSFERRDRVLKAIEELGYKPNAHAQGLRRGQNALVGLCIPHVSNTYFMRLVDIFEKLSIVHGFETVHVYARRDADHLLEKVEWLIKFQVGGLIMLPSIDSRPTFDAIARSRIPAVIIDRPVDDSRFDQVVTDAAGAMESIIRGLSARGHRDILFVTASKSFLVTKVRMEGLHAARDSLPDVTANVIEVGEGIEGMDRLLASEFERGRPPTALVVGSARLAAGTFRSLRRLGSLIEVWPEIVSFDEPEWADLSEPRVSIVRAPIEEIAAMAWKLLLRRIQGFNGPPEQHQLAAEVILSGAQPKAP
jgi:LacI family transcriptional regulator